MPFLKSVTSELPDPPYPADTKANGYKPEVDINRIEVSDTWTLAECEQRPWLLRIWMESWRSVPVGSMPKDRTIFARRIGCKPAFLEANADILLRGWILHSDDRLYHSCICEIVLQMISKRTNAKDRQRKAREKKTKENKERSKMSRVTSRESHAEQEQEQEQEYKKQAKKEIRSTSAFSLPPEISPNLWDEFEAHRVELHEADKKKNPLLTDRARKQAASILKDLTPQEQMECLRVTVSSGWKTFFPNKSKPVHENQPTAARRIRL